MATFTKRTDSRGNVRYQAKCRRRDRPTLSKTFVNLSDAKKWARETERGWDNGEVLAKPQDDTTLADVLRRYREEVCPTLRAGDLTVMRINLWLRESWTKVPVREMTPAILAKYRDDRLKQVKPGTVLRELNILRAALNRAKLEWGIDVPECRITRPKAPAPRDRRLQPGEFERLRKGCEQSRIQHLWPAIELAVETAARQGELLALRWDNVDLDRKIARFPMTKNGRPRTIPLSNRAVEILDGLNRKKGEPRVLWAFGKDQRCSLKHAFVRLTKRVGIEGLHYHDLRRESISRMIERGLSVAEIQVCSGHRTLSQLAVYSAPDPVAIAAKLG